MLNRIIISIIIIGTLFLLLKLTRLRQKDQAQRKAASLTTPHGSQLLYFSSAACSQCRGQESVLNHALKDLELRGITLQKYTVENHATLARQWGVKTLPTTILLSSTGEVKQFNNGLISTTTLLSQLQQLQQLQM